MRYSIVIPARNAEKTIARAVRSAVAQTFADFEVIVVVNDTTDSTLRVLSSFRDDRIRVVQARDRGRSRARNLGLDTAQGDYVLFLDADDELDPRKLANTEMCLAASPTCTAVQGGTEVRGEDGPPHVIPPYSSHDFYDKLLIQNFIPINSMAISRGSAARFDVGMEHSEDWLFWLRSLAGRSICSYPHTDAFVYRHVDNTSLDVTVMRASELICRLDFWNAPSATRLGRLKRSVLMAFSIATYAGIESRAPIEGRLAEHSTARWFIHHLRRRPRLRELVHTFLARAMKVTN